MSKGKLTPNSVHLEEHEYTTVRVFLESGYDIELIPPSKIKGIRKPDIMMLGIPWEMKAPQGDGKNTMRHIIQNAGHQSSNVIIDLRRCKLKESQAIHEAMMYFKISRQIKRMKLITSDKKIIDIP